MSSQVEAFAQSSERTWSMPIAPENYDRGPFTDKERWALTQIENRQLSPSTSRWRTAQKQLVRLDQPIVDVFQLRHMRSQPQAVSDVHRVMRREMYDRDKIFWEWAPSEWIEVLGP